MSNCKYFTDSRSKYFGNRATEFGGAVSISSIDVVKQVRCIYIANVAKVSGGTMALWGVQMLMIISGSFDNNKAYFGAAIFTEQSKISVLKGVKLLNNNAIDSGR